MEQQVFEEILKKYWGYDTFRPLQGDIIQSIAKGHDTFAILPTGGGKSICYQVPALYFTGLTVIISPLIALMEDQVIQLQQREIPAAYLHSGLDSQEQLLVVNQCIDGAIKILYLAPERAVSSGFKKYWSQLPISFIAVDEAHCISQWGHDFRPYYLELASLREELSQVPILAVTASATIEVQKDIIQFLKLSNHHFYQQSVVRSNLTYQVAYSENKIHDIITLAQEHLSTGIIYANSRKLTRSLSDILKSEGRASCYYHAGLSLDQRAQQQSIWMQSNKHVMVATNAFGMGIDKPDVRFVTHLILPQSLEEYYQEAGRAGRDEQPAWALLFYNQADIENLKSSINESFPSMKWIQEVYHRISDYLYIPVGAGEEYHHPFSIEDFCAKQDLPIQLVLSVIKIIQKEGIWEFDNSVKTQNLLTLRLRSEDMDTLSKMYPSLAELLIIVLRTYGSVYNHETKIHLKTLSQQIRWTEYQVHQALLKLMSMSYVDYQPAIIGGTIYYYQSRMSKQHFHLNEKRLLLSKKSLQKRIHALIHYLQDDETCRNILFSNYFGQESYRVAPCGQCDNCQRIRRSNIKESIKVSLLNYLNEHPSIVLNEVFEIFPNHSPQQITSQLRQLIDDGLIIFDTFDKIKKAR